MRLNVALHLLECPEITVSTKFAKRIKKKGVQEFSDKAKQKQLQVYVSSGDVTFSYKMICGLFYCFPDT